MVRECGISKREDDPSKPLILKMVEKFRVGDYGPAAVGSAKKSLNSDEYSNSPNQMQPHFGGANQSNDLDHTPPTTGVQGSGGENNHSRKNTRNQK